MFSRKDLCLSNDPRRGQIPDAVDRIAGDGVVLAEIVEQGGERRELAADAGGSEFAFFEVLAPGDDGVGGATEQKTGLSAAS
jgi:hypothetical protein